MPTSALALAAASLHALWNVLLARAEDPEAATAVALLVSVLAFAPAAALTWDIDRAAAPWVAASAGLELGYFALLAAAYRRAELGLVYPLSRGLAPVLVLAISSLALAEAPSGRAAAGVLLVAGGVLLVRGVGRRADGRGTALALAIAACIASYTIVDDHGVRHAAPLPYLELVLAGPAVLYALAVRATRGRSALRAELRPSTVVAGVSSFGAYVLVLAALARAPAAPVAAVRETSVVLAALLATLLLREPFHAGRIAGSAVVAAGIALLALGG